MRIFICIVHDECCLRYRPSKTWHLIDRRMYTANWKRLPGRSAGGTTHTQALCPIALIAFKCAAAMITMRVRVSAEGCGVSGVWWQGWVVGREAGCGVRGRSGRVYRVLAVLVSVSVVSAVLSMLCHFAPNMQHPHFCGGTTLVAGYTVVPRGERKKEVWV